VKLGTERGKTLAEHDITLVMLLPMAEEGLAGGAGLGAEQAHVALVGRQVFGLDMIVDVGGFAPRPTVNAFPHS